MRPTPVPGRPTCSLPKPRSPNGRSGTLAGYKEHIRYGETPCDACYQAYAQYHRDYRKKLSRTRRGLSYTEALQAAHTRAKQYISPRTGEITGIGDRGEAWHKIRKRRYETWNKPWVLDVLLNEAQHIGSLDNPGTHELAAYLAEIVRAIIEHDIKVCRKHGTDDETAVLEAFEVAAEELRNHQAKLDLQTTPITPERN